MVTLDLDNLPDNFHPLWPTWVLQGACRSKDPRVFDTEGEQAEPARRICAGCRVLTDCRDWSLALPSNTSGVIGGLSRRERTLWRKRGGPPPSDPHKAGAEPTPEEQELAA